MEPSTSSDTIPKPLCFSSTEPRLDVKDLAQDLVTLTEEQREKALNDLYGKQTVNETPAFIEDKLFELDLSLEKADEERLGKFKGLLAVLEVSMSYVTRQKANALLKNFKYSHSDVFSRMLDRVKFLGENHDNVNNNNSISRNNDNKNNNNSSNSSISISISSSSSNNNDNNQRETFIEVTDIESALEELALELNSLQKMEPAVQAQYLCPDIANSDSFRTMFLRAEHFDVELAAIRLTSYWKEKAILFGRRAFKKLTLSDMYHKDEKAIRSGGFQMLPKRDSCGRPIFFSYRGGYDLRPDRRASMVRIMWYLLHTVADDEFVQKNGVVGIFTDEKDAGSPNNDIFSFKLNRMLIRSSILMPVRFVGIHVVVRNYFFRRLVIPSCIACLPSTQRARIKDHNAGDIEETLSTLNEYGMPPNTIPREIGGSLDFDYNAWLDERGERGL